MPFFLVEATYTADAWAKLVERAGERSHRPVGETLRQWPEDADLSAVRDAGALAGMPEAEREQWRSLWADVENLLTAIQGP